MSKEKPELDAKKTVNKSINSANLEEIMAELNVSILPFYSFVKYKSNTEDGVNLVTDYLVKIADVREYLSGLLNGNKDKGVTIDSFMETSQTIEECSDQDVIKSVLDGSNNFFTFILTVGNDEEGRKLHTELMEICRKVKKYYDGNGGVKNDA